MDVTIQSDGPECFIVTCPAEMAWQARIDLVEIFRAAAAGRKVRGIILDLNQVTFISSAGLGAIFALRKYAQEIGARVVVARPGMTITRLLNTVNMAALIPVTSTLDQARAHLVQASNA